MTGRIFWNGRAVAFRAGETAGSALARAGIRRLGTSETGLPRALFCGIGQCQNCLVLLDGAPTEACLLICRDGMRLHPTDGDGADG